MKQFKEIVYEDKIDCDKNLYINGSYREDEKLIKIIEELGEDANSSFSNFKIVEIPDDMKYVIDDYDGVETLHEDVETW